jgi:hypothetical protein
MPFALYVLEAKPLSSTFTTVFDVASTNQTFNNAVTWYTDGGSGSDPGYINLFGWSDNYKNQTVLWKNESNLNYNEISVGFYDAWPNKLLLHAYMNYTASKALTDGVDSFYYRIRFANNSGADIGGKYYVSMRYLSSTVFGDDTNSKSITVIQNDTVAKSITNSWSEARIDISMLTFMNGKNIEQTYNNFVFVVQFDSSDPFSNGSIIDLDYRFVKKTADSNVYVAGNVVAGTLGFLLVISAIFATPWVNVSGKQGWR